MSATVRKTVRDLTHPGLITCRSTASLGEEAVILTQHHLHARVVAAMAIPRSVWSE